MLFLLIFLFFAELFVSLKVGLIIGFGWSVVWIVVSSIIGVLLLRLSPYALWSNFQSFNFGNFDIQDVHNASIAYLIGSILLIIPGVLTDILGVALLLYVLYLHLFARIKPSIKQENNNFKQQEGETDVIDVKIIDERSSIDSNRSS